VLLPHLAGVVVERIARVGGVIEIGARARGSTATCPGCGERSDRVHSRDERSLADAAIGGPSVRIRLRVRRFVCRRTAHRRANGEAVPGVGRRGTSFHLTFDST
jgi:transposase